uniref:Interferon n=1 Tax=Tetraodon nigroviridis TaxID=99883 RepID=H3C0V7_TETNG
MLTVLLCLSLCVCSQGSPLGCRWLEEKFTQYSSLSLNLLDNMKSNSTNSSLEAEDTAIFPEVLYRQTFNASAEDRLAFAAQILNETAALFEEDYSGASWEEKSVENFVNILTQQADNLGSCVASPGQSRSKELHKYFTRISTHILRKTDHSAGAWELVREKIRSLLMRAHLLLTTH